ncbi:small ribosomal subunit Rsm22 family protein [Nonomuraea sp. NPDC046570]|uniref:small ribosomal subunit Rsm22 family protein n=1 Tax=Nonomuraea sp. NPDC046570 TaxID=3155255 RepID=UPI0033E1F9AE
MLGEMPSAAQEAVVRWSAERAATVVVVEPGTPEGYARVLAARDRLIGLGLRIAAPCPHAGPCPVTAGDWCHFSARLPRTGLHRRLKAAELGFEDDDTAPPTGPLETRHGVIPGRKDEHRPPRERQATLEEGAFQVLQAPGRPAL